MGFAAGFAAAIEGGAKLGTAEQRIARRREERRARARASESAKAAKAAKAAGEPSSAERASSAGEDKAAEAAAAAAKAALATESSGQGANVDGPTRPGQPLGHVHKIDYAELGVDEAEMRRLREKFAGTNSLDTALYERACAGARRTARCACPTPCTARSSTRKRRRRRRRWRRAST